MLHVKKTDELQFLFETAVKNNVDDTVTELVEIWNMQIQVPYYANQSLIESLILCGKLLHPNPEP